MSASALRFYEARGPITVDRAPGRRDWARRSQGWTARIAQRIPELERRKTGMTESIGRGCLSLDRCRLANPNNRAARLGQGPRS